MELNKDCVGKTEASGNNIYIFILLKGCSQILTNPINSRV